MGTKERTKPAHARAAIGAQTRQQGSWVDTIIGCRRVARAMLAIRMEVESSPKWVNARRRPECKRLCQEAHLLEQLWSLLLEGLQAANFGEAPSGIVDENGRTLHFANRAAGKVIKCLGEHLPSILPDYSKMRNEETKPSKALDCVEAWREALPHLTETKRRYRKPDVWAALDRLKQSDPALYGRLRVSIAIGNAGQEALPEESKRELAQIRVQIRAQFKARTAEGLGQPGAVDRLRDLEAKKTPFEKEIDNLGKAALFAVIIADDGPRVPLKRAFMLATWALGFPAKHPYDEAKRRAKLGNLPEITIVDGESPKRA